MTLELTPGTEALLREEATRRGCDVNAVGDTLLARALADTAREFEETMAGIERGWRAGEEGRERPLAEYVEDVRRGRKQAGNAAV